MITESEFYYKIKNMQFLWPAKDTEDSTNRLHNCIPEEICVNLPVITWDVCKIFFFLFFFFLKEKKYKSNYLYLGI